MSLLTDVSESAFDTASAVRAVERGLGDPNARSATRREVAADLFHDPGRATERCVAALYEVLELEAPHRTVPGAACQGPHAQLPASGQPTAGTRHAAPGTRPTVSVVMPAFNAARYVDTAITSVLAQTVENLELIVVDDGSEDDTAAVVARRAASDPRVHLFRQSNAGPGPARNTAFRVARGKYFAFLDSDDEWAPTFLERQLSVLEAKPDVDVLFGNAFYRGGARDGRPARSTMPDERCLGLADLLADENLHFIMAVFRREVIDAVHGFNPAFLTNEEYELWLRAGLAGFTFARNAEPLGWYSCRPGSLSSSDTRMLKGALRVLAHTRPLLPEGSIERPILDRTAARFEAELAAARVRDSLTGGDPSAARIHLAALHRRRGGWALKLAARLPRAAMALYRVRQAVRSGA